jgi:ubiquitin-conjugating enzyme E2 M
VIVWLVGCGGTDLDQMEEIPGAKLSVPDPDNPLRFQVTITPDDGFWKRGVYQFNMVVPLPYPVEPPKVTCLTQVCLSSTTTTTSNQH